MIVFGSLWLFGNEGGKSPEKELNAEVELLKALFQRSH